MSERDPRDIVRPPRKGSFSSEEKQFLVSRRMLLGGAAVLSGYALLGGQATPAHAQTSSASSWFRSGEFDVARATSFSTDWGQRVATPFPIRIPLSRPAHAGSLRIDWDARLFDAPTRAFSIVDGVTVNAAVTPLAEGAVSIAVPKGAQDIVAPVRVRNPYPEENLAEVSPTVLRYINAGQKTLEELKLRADVVAGSAWGVEAQVSWVTVGGDIVPAVVTLTSVGPGAVPAGVVANLSYPDLIRAEPTILGFDEPADVPFALSSRSERGTRQLSIETVATVAAGVRTDFVFAVEGSDSLPGEWPRTVPRLTLSVPRDSVGQRLTEKTNVFPVTASGTQLSTYLGATRALELATQEEKER